MNIRETEIEGSLALVWVDFCPGINGARVSADSYFPWHRHRERSLKLLQNLQRMMRGKRTEIREKDSEFSLHILDGDPLGLVSELKRITQKL